MAAGLTYPPVFSDDYLQKTAGLSERASELVYHMDRASIPAEGFDHSGFEYELLYYGKEKKEEMPCIVSTGT
eukprot:9884256-Karenia_brevis.AAC.1